MDEHKEKKSTFGLSQRNQYIVVGVLVAVLGGVLIYQLAGKGEAKADVTPAASEEPAPQSAAAAAPPSAPVAVPAEPNPVVCAPAIDRDPFTMPKALKEMLDQAKPMAERGRAQETRGPDPAILAQARAFSLKGIISDSDGRIAYINDSPVQAGATIEGFTVVEVREKSVLLKKDQTEVTLELKPPARKRGSITPAPSKPQDTGGSK